MFSYVFRNPEILSVALYVFPFVLAFSFWIAFREVQVRLAKRIPGTISTFSRWSCFPGILVLIIIAMAELIRFSTDVLTEDLRGRVAFLIDNSYSMQAGEEGDIPNSLAQELSRKGIFPTRLALCKEEFREALRGVRGLEAVIITFTGATNLRVGDWTPVFQKEMSSQRFNLLLESVEPAWMGSGTNPARVFVETRALFGVEPDIALLCSDGDVVKGGSLVSHQEIINQLKAFTHQLRKQIPVFVLGVGGGTDGPVSIPVLSPLDGRILGHSRDASGRENLTEFFPDILQDIAEESGGEYIYVENLDDGRKLLSLAVLMSIQQGEIEVESARSMSHWFIIPAFIFTLFLGNGFAWIRALFSRNK